MDKFALHKKHLARKTSMQNENTMSYIEQHSSSQEQKIDVLEDIHQNIEERYKLAPVHLNTDVPQVGTEEVKKLLSELKQAYHKDKLEKLLSDCKQSVAEAIIKLFGLAKILFQDKDGGNVTTLHNRKNGVYTNETDTNIYQKKLDANTQKEYRKQAKRKRDEIAKQTETVTDAYTGKELNIKDCHLDHVVPLSEYYQDRELERVLGAEKFNNLVNSDANLQTTLNSINQSKSDKTMQNFVDTHKKGQEHKNAERFGIDREQTKKLDEEARKEKAEAEKFVKKTNEANFRKDTLTNGVGDGVKMGFQQAIGLVIYEFTKAVFDEIKDVISNGFYEKDQNNSFFEELGNRFTTIAKKVGDKWGNAVSAFQTGFVTGFLSSIVTTLINTFMTTAKNVVRIIREGFLSLFHALKMVIFRPEGMTFNESAHEATKLFVSGITIAGGIVLEEVISKATLTIIPPPFNGYVVPVLTGIATGFAVSLFNYLIDKADFWGVEAEKEQNYISQKLDESFNQKLAEAHSIIDNAIKDF